MEVQTENGDKKLSTYTFSDIHQSTGRTSLEFQTIDNQRYIHLLCAKNILVLKSKCCIILFLPSLPTE